MARTAKPGPNEWLDSLRRKLGEWVDTLEEALRPAPTPVPVPVRVRRPAGPPER